MFDYSEGLRLLLWNSLISGLYLMLIIFAAILAASILDGIRKTARRARRNRLKRQQRR